VSDLRIQPLPPETLAVQRPVVDPSRAAGITAAATPAAAASSQGNASGGGSGAAGGEAPRDQYISPFITIDPTSGLVITQYRNSETGQLQKQYPSEKAVREYRNLQPAVVSASGERGAAPASGARAADPAATADGPIAGRAPAPAPAVQSPAPVQAAAPSPAAQPAAPGPSGGLDKGSA